MKRRPEIPMDVMMEILTRLPAKSLMRFKCVSKLWSSLICSRYFSNRFLTVPSPRLYIFNNYHGKCAILSLAPDNTTPSSFVVVDQDLTIPRMGRRISHSFYGFVCDTFSEKTQFYNPTTRQLVTLPAIKSSYMIQPGGLNTSSRIMAYHFGHDPVNDLYKVICTVSETLIYYPERIKSEYWVFVLKPGGSWKKVVPPLVDFCPHEPVRGRGLSINGVIYYMARIAVYNLAVVSFDIRSEEFKTIRVPHKDGVALHKWIWKLSLIEYGGKVTVFDSHCLSDNGMVDLWVLEDEEWSRKTLLLQPCQLHLVKNTIFKVNGTTQNGKVILIPRGKFLSHILCYDVINNYLGKIEIKGIPDHWFSKVRTTRRIDLLFSDQSESIIYLET